MLTHARVPTPTKVLEKLSLVRSALGKIDLEVRLHHYKIREFQPKISFDFERGPYVLKTAQNGVELEKCLKLRYDVFHREYKNKKREVGIDIDHLDYDCDHLVIMEKATGQVIGTYRLNSSLFTDTFYSTNEFHMDSVLALPGNKLELGRACIDRQHRNGAVLSLLWRGIVEYARQTETDILFGCASIKTMEPMEIGLLKAHFENLGRMTSEFQIEPTKKYKVKALSQVSEYLESHPWEYDADAVDALVPPLLKMYFKAGAKLVGDPALDREFRCIDFLCVMKIAEMNPVFKGKYSL